MKTITLFTFIALALFLTIGCSDFESPVSSEGTTASANSNSNSISDDFKSGGDAQILSIEDPFGDPVVVDLIAGQHMDVGLVTVANDGENLCVTLVTEDGWVITESHVAFGMSLDAIPQTKKGNPIPGQFPYSHDLDEGDDFDEYCFNFAEMGHDIGHSLIIAVHAVVEKINVIEAAPYAGFSITDVNQGLRKNGTPVDDNRSDPDVILTLGDGSVGTFFSLGFGGDVTVEFECPVINGEGADVLVTETTWGYNYPLEKIEVYASQDGINWTFLGNGDNTEHGDYYNTTSSLDLGDLEWAQYIKIIDISDPAVHNSTADGYDLNAVQAIHDCVEIDEETAWGNGEDFPGKNWAMYFGYTIQDQN